MNEFNYNKILTQLLPNISECKGNGVVVAIVDTGCVEHQSIKKNIIRFYNAITKTEETNYTDDTGHGTFITGLICANGTDSEITGVAPEVKIIIVKASLEGNFFRENVLNGLEWLLNTCPEIPHIINMSFDFSPNNLINEFQLLFEAATKKGILLISAGQDDENLSLANYIYYPAKENGVFAIGAIQKDINTDFTLTSKISYVIPKKDDYESIIKLNDPLIPKGCSFASAIVSGTLSLIISDQLINPEELSATDKLNQHIEAYSIKPLNNNLNIYSK